jgi:membrane protein DedA with SNARE-associated domain
VERWFGRAAPAIVLIAPNGYVCLLAGAAGMRVRTFVALNVIGTIGRLTLFTIAGAALRNELLDVLDFIQRYQWWLVAVSFLVVAIQTGRRRSAPDSEAADDLTTS